MSDALFPPRSNCVSPGLSGDVRGSLMSATTSTPLGPYMMVQDSASRRVTRAPQHPLCPTCFVCMHSRPTAGRVAGLWCLAGNPLLMMPALAARGRLLAQAFEDIAYRSERRRRASILQLFRDGERELDHAVALSSRTGHVGSWPSRDAAHAATCSEIQALPPPGHGPAPRPTRLHGHELLLCHAETAEIVPSPHATSIRPGDALAPCLCAHGVSTAENCSVARGGVGLV